MQGIFIIVLLYQNHKKNISLFFLHFHVPAAFISSGVPDEAVGLIGDLLDDVGIDIVTAV